MSLESVPKDMRGLRACKLCSLVKVSFGLVMDHIIVSASIGYSMEDGTNRERVFHYGVL